MAQREVLEQSKSMNDSIIRMLSRMFFLAIVLVVKALAEFGQFRWEEGTKPRAAETQSRTAGSLPLQGSCSTRLHSMETETTLLRMRHDDCDALERH